MRLRALSTVALLLALAAPAAAEDLARSAILVSYDFDGEAPSTGPDTFTLVQEGRGRVRLTDARAFSGRNAVEIRDASGDGAFPDFLGHLPLRRDGFLFVHFAWMVEDPQERLNIGLLGPRWCTIAKDGISFWLFLEKGTLHHVSGRSSRPLFRPEPGHWYLFDLFYDVGRGRYDLLVQDAEGERVTDVQGAANPAGVPGSAVFKFSFAGDLHDDASDVTYYVDDVVISVDSPVSQPRFVAPGRRELFFDRWSRFHEALRERPSCLPPLELADLGFAPRHVGALQRDGLLAEVTALLEGREPRALPISSSDPEVSAGLRAYQRWRGGCAALADGDAAAALDAFRAASRDAPAARLYPLSEVFALAALGRWPAADARLAEVYGAWRDDDRLPAVMAALGVARGDLEEARDWLHRPAESALAGTDRELLARLQEGAIDARLVAAVKRRFPERWHDPIRETLVADQYFFVLLWSERVAEAERYAHALAHRLHALGLTSRKWMERAADAAFVQGRLDVAEHRYHVALHENPHPTSPLLKLSDVYHARGDRAKEQEYREMVFGAFR